MVSDSFPLYALQFPIYHPPRRRPLTEPSAALIAAQTTHTPRRFPAPSPARASSRRFPSKPPSFWPAKSATSSPRGTNFGGPLSQPRCFACGANHETSLVAASDFFPPAMSPGVWQRHAKALPIVRLRGLLSRLFLGFFATRVLYTNSLVAREGDIRHLGPAFSGPGAGRRMNLPTTKGPGHENQNNRLPPANFLARSACAARPGAPTLPAKQPLPPARGTPPPAGYVAEAEVGTPLPRSAHRRPQPASDLHGPTLIKSLNSEYISSALNPGSHSSADSTNPSQLRRNKNPDSILSLHERSAVGHGARRRKN